MALAAALHAQWRACCRTCAKPQQQCPGRRHGPLMQAGACSRPVKRQAHLSTRRSLARLPTDSCLPSAHAPSRALGACNTSRQRGGCRARSPTAAAEASGRRRAVDLGGNCSPGLPIARRPPRHGCWVPGSASRRAHDTGEGAASHMASDQRPRPCPKPPRALTVRRWGCEHAWEGGPGVAQVFEREWGRLQLSSLAGKAAALLDAIGQQCELGRRRRAAGLSPLGGPTRTSCRLNSRLPSRACWPWNAAGHVWRLLAGLQGVARRLGGWPAPPSPGRLAGGSRKAAVFPVPLTASDCVCLLACVRVAYERGRRAGAGCEGRSGAAGLRL